MKNYFKRIAAIVLALTLTLTLSLTATAFAATTTTALDKAVTDTAAYMHKTVTKPEVGSVGGEWAVIGLARSGYAVPDSYYQTYYATVEAYVKDCEGVLHEKKYTEYSRVILGLTAAGYDPRNVAGYDLTAPLADFDKTIWQGINSTAYALIALDSSEYANTQRDKYIAEILRRQMPDGSWTEYGASDTTGFVLQALAAYQDKPEVKAATDKAVAFLSKLQDAQGGYSSSDGACVESAVQVLVALCELGISVDDARFVKNGKTLVDNILSFQ
ncbi:MAG: hypothetical protein LBS90_04630, partial [Oscillospiraceae bacterium]|nr:hypothetical protein [Oscillospiraceae bacterium]